MIDEGTQLKELADGKPRNCYNLERTRRRIEHPIRHLEGAAMRLPDQEMVNTVVLMVAGHQNRPADQRVERIGDHRFECQKPGTMAPAPTPVGSIGPPSPRSSRPASCAASNPTPISPTSSPRSSTAISTAASTICCHGPIAPRQNSRPWPDNVAYIIRLVVMMYVSLLTEHWVDISHETVQF